MATPTPEELNNLGLDVAHISEVATSTAPTAVDRLGNVKATMAAASNAVAQTAAGQATFARLAAEAARDVAQSAAAAALIQAGTYATEADGRAAVQDGQFFKVQGNPTGRIAAYEYKRISADTSELKATYPSASMPTTPNLTSFLTPVRNMFNYRNRTVGKYLTDTGILANNPAYDVSDYIKVKPGVMYVVSSPFGARYLTFYDANMILVAGGNEGVSPFTVPPNARYVRATLFAQDVLSFQIEIGRYSTSYVQYENGCVSDDGTKIVVHPGDTSFLAIGKNKFNPATVTKGWAINVNGIIFENPSYMTSDFIEVSEGTYTANATLIRLSAFFDANKMAVAGGYDGTAINQFAVPSGVKYVRLTVPNEATNVQIERGNTATTFEQYSYVLADKSGVPIIVSSETAAAESAFDSPVMADVQYCPAGLSLNLYTANVSSDPEYTDGFVGVSVNFTPTKQTSDFTQVNPAIGESGTQNAGNVVIVGKNRDGISGAKGHSILVKFPDPTKVTPISVLPIGDSFSYRMSFANVLLGSAAKTGVSFLGLRTSTDNSPPIKTESQGGWTLESYFTVDFKVKGVPYLSPFMQPVNAFRYYGPVSFWIDANSATPSYNAANFIGAKDAFSASTGFKLAPNVNDVMSTDAGYVKWNSAAWVPTTLAELGGFEFNFAKYLATFGIATPNAVHVMFGANDFYSATNDSFESTYSRFKSNYEKLITSVKAASSAIKIVIGIPVSSARQGVHGTMLTENVRLSMWKLARNMNRDFSGRDSAGVYLADYHSSVSRVYGFDYIEEKPYSDYTGNDRYKYYSDITHCSKRGSDEMGVTFMGVMQYIR